MLELVLIRPGATDYDNEHRIQGTLNIPLNAQGNREVAREIEQLRDRGIEVLYTSDSDPARQTAEAIAKALGIRVKKLEDMHNLDHGLWQGMSVDEIRRKHPRVYRQWQDEPDCVCPPKGETLDQARERVMASLTWILKRHRSGIVGLVLPEPLASVARNVVDHREIGDLWRSADDHGSWETVVVEPGNLSVAS